MRVKVDEDEVEDEVEGDDEGGEGRSSPEKVGMPPQAIAVRSPRHQPE